MTQKIKSILILAAFAVFSAACAAQPVAGASNDPPAGSNSDSVEDTAGLIKALESAGAEVKAGDPIDQAFFSVPGGILKVNGADVQVFEYQSAEAMGTEASQVSEDGSTIGTNMVSWVEAPHFFQSGRLLVLYVGTDTAILDLLKEMLGEQFAGR